MTRFLEQSLFLTILLLSLLTIAIRSEGAVPRSELVEDDLRRLHQDDLGEWPGQIAVAVFPDDSDVAGLALPGSHPIRPRNQYRRRRKRPRPQVPQDRPVYLAEGPENSYPELIPHQPHHSYIVPDPPQRDEDNSPETTIYDNSQPSQRPQKPQIKELSYSPTNKPNIQNDKRQPSDSIFEDSKDSNEEDVTFDINNTDTYNPNKSPRKDQNEQAESSEDSIESSIKIGGFKPSIHTPNNSHRKPYSAKSHGQNIESPSPQDLKALLKQQSGSLSLSEILQQKNLSLADLLKGNRNALSALTGTRNSPPENLDDAPPRRLPPASGNARLKHQNVNNNNNNNNNNQRPHRYSVKNAQILDDYSSEPTVNRRLPPINGAPSRKNPYLTENQRPIRYREQVHLQDQEDEEIPERINKFVPSSPRRTTTAQPSEEPLNNDKDFSPSTDSSIVTNSIIPEDSDLLSQSALFNQNKKKENKLVIEQKDTANIPTTEHNKIIVEPPEPIQRDSSEFTSSQQTIEQKPKSDPIPLTVQETENLDPLHNSEAENTNSDHKRLRGKYPSRHRISVAQSPNGNNKEDAIANRVRLPPPNVFLSALRPKINNRVTTTDQPTMKATETTTEVNSVQKDDISVKISTTTPMVKSENANAVILEPKVKQHNSFKTEDDDDGNVIVGKPKISIPIEFRHDTKNKEHENDGPMHKVIPFQIETSTKTNKIKSTSARDELLEFLKTDTGSIRLARILASRNMTLAELIDHRERGSSQQHLAEIFKETTQSQTALTNDPEDAETISTQDTLNNDDMFSILKNFQESISTNTNSKSNVIPSLHEMFGLLNSQDKSHNEPKQGPEKRTESITEGHNLASRNEYFQPHDEKPYRESRIFESLPTFPHEQPLVPIHRPNYPQHPQMVPQWNPYQNPSSIYSFEPVNPYINSGQRPIITSRLTTTSPHTPVIEEITDGIILLENIGHVRELGNKIKGQTHRDDNKRFDGTYRQHELEDEVSGGLPKDVKSAIIVSSAILGAAILGFLAIFVVCRWRQRQARRRYVDGIVNTRARSPILMQPEGKQCSRSLSPVMVSSHDLYKRELSTDGEDETTNPGARRYYLWRTIRKTLKYK